MTRKQIVIAFLMLAGGTVVFSLVSGLEERFLFEKWARTARAQPATPIELMDMFVHSSVRALPYGAVATFIIAIVIAPFAGRLKSSSTFFRLWVGGVLGGVAGCVLAIAYQLVGGGKELLFVLSPIVTGTMIGIGVFALLRPPPLLPGHCPCGYDLTGNASGVCPECGMEIDSP